MPTYTSWRQVAGYFDGDGTIAISDTSNQPYKLGLSLSFVDQSAFQIRNLKRFLESRGITTSNILKTSKGSASMIAISRFDDVRRMLGCMLPFLCKKETEAKAALDYYEGRITGNRLASAFHQEVEKGRRERRPRKVPINVPYTYPEGDKKMKGNRRVKLRDAIGRYRAKVTPEDYRDIREAFFGEGVPLHDLARKYSQYARETTRRILGRGRGYVLVKGKGIVRATHSR